MSAAYYNEHDVDKAAWLRELIKANLIAPGEVDERNIQDVLPRELVGYTQCHFFAGIGIWSYSLRGAGWPDNRRVWTGSCPCQPFSDAGQRKGTSDERHLWPAFFHLIRVCKPDVVFGEQVAKKNGLAWLDIVQADLEAAAYAVGAVVIPACGFGAPHKRERLYFVADANGNGAQRAGREEQFVISGCAAGVLADANGSGRAWQGQAQSEERWGDPIAARRSSPSSVADSELPERRTQAEGRGDDAHGADAGRQEAPGGSGLDRPTNGFWRDAEWIYCRDEKYRAVEPGAFPLAHGAAARILRLRGYGDGIVAPVAEEFIRAYIEVSGNSHKPFQQ